MTKELFEIFFNIIVNAYQGFIVTWFLVQCLKLKEQYSKKLVYIVGTITIFAYLEVQVLITNFEGIGVLLLMAFTSLFSVLFFQGTFIRKLLYNVILIISTVFTATLVGSIVGLISSVGYIQLVSNNSMPKYISMVLNQIVLWIVFQFIVKLIRQNMLGFHAGYTVLVISMSVISVFTVVVLQHLVEGRNEQYKLFYTCAVVVGIILLLTVSLIMYGINERNHIEKLQQEMEISAYRRQKHDVKEITRNYQEMENVRHEMNKVIVTTSRLLQDGKYAEAQKFIEQFQTEENDRVRKVYYTDNIILNYLLNQKIEVCQKRNIHMKYIINGVIDGIKDIDLHCIVSNLLDNAIEATQKLDNKNISFSIFGNPYSIYIEVSNTVAENVLQCNPKLQSSKTEGHHGYGIKNVRATVEKYQGEIRYRQKLEGYLTCEVVMMKNFTTETGNLRHDN